MRDPVKQRLAAFAVVLTVAALVPVLTVGFRAGSDQGGSPVIRTQSGLVEGVTEQKFEEFLGLPYAAPPVRELRFAPPAAPASWQGVRAADRQAPACLQFEPTGVREEQSTSEDCLYLDLYRPRGGGRKLPVMVWFHGGGHTQGTAVIYGGGTPAAKTGTIVISVNYRLGALGFLAHPALSAATPGGSGNYGRMDQLASLRWVNANIARFGGDPDNVTIYGQSAGGSAVCDMLAMPSAKRLFDKAIVESSSCFNVRNTLSAGEQSGVRLNGKEPMKYRSVCVALLTAGLVGLGLTSSVAAPDRDPLVVQTNNGAVRGAAQTGYDAWLGIPYAADPTGEHRWTAPRPAAQWSGVRDATRFGDRCVQGSGWDPGYENTTHTENCLSLNVYAPAQARNLPVLVWIHGGGFTGGAGQDTNPRKFVQQANAVVVTINYRLGALGFLNLPGLPGAGNFGLLDQQAALRWVNANITRFGGDSRNVTIAGQSAGGSSVCAQLASPTAKGLFARAVIMSGGCSLQSATAGQSSSQAFVQAVGCAGTPDVLACLRTRPPADIIAAQQKAGVRPSQGGTAFPTDPGTAVPAGKFNRVPVLLGQVNSERALSTFQNYDFAGKPLTAPQYEALVRSTYGENADKVLAEYPLSRFESPGIAWTTMQNDQTSTTRQELFGALSRHVPTFAYEFAESDTPHFVSIYLIQQQSEMARNFPFLGATHVDDLGYLWEYLGQTLPYSDDQLELSNQMIRYFGRFTASGDPNGARTPQWPRYRASTDAIMSLSACDTSPATSAPPAACSTMSTRFGAEHNTAFWRNLTG